nr:MAG: GXGXG motif-containing protein [Candidatus Kentron sp. TUN]
MTGGVVVVLGSTGRNFAAGMSGGIAYVLDEKGDFNIRYNPAMVELEAIVEDDVDKDALLQSKNGQPPELPEDMLTHDALRLHMLIGRHVYHTGSDRGKIILGNWEKYLPKFVKVMPVEYRKVLENLAK